MNATIWHTLTGFVQYLGNSGKCKIDHNEKGWYIQYIDQEEVIRKAEEAKRAKAEKDDEERQQEMIQAQVRRALEQQGEVVEPQATELIRTDENEKITLDLNPDKKPTAAIMEKNVAGRDSSKPSTSKRDEKPKKSALDEIREQQERLKEKKNRKDYWLHEGIVVKIITKKLGDDYYKVKGVVKSLIDDYTASVKLDDGTLVKLDQAHVETVIPGVGREMKIVNGAYRGCVASYTMSLQGEVVKGSLKLKKGDIFKEEKEEGGSENDRSDHQKGREDEHSREDEG
ncbi:hypothetical protein ANCCEY_00563 [Ancylostoma ceylanicum]|uniref:DNA/RNA-binding protein Kin17 WH-like domain-containing protein n=1 Tax=Ancylostoma ceylanicum TaxID=53326 RepID=A0A0D6MBG3_9BILA|nr:hypothetical protein ANCCEY_00563 [Ancylostoma ceylanicum]